MGLQENIELCKNCKSEQVEGARHYLLRGVCVFK